MGGEHVPHPLRTLRQLWQQPQAEARESGLWKRRVARSRPPLRWKGGILSWLPCGVQQSDDRGQHPAAEAAPLWSWLTDAASSIRSGGTTTPGTVEFDESQARLSHVERPERVCGSVLWGHTHSLLSSVQLFLSACEHASSPAQVEEQRHFLLVAAASNREMALPG